LMASVCRNLGLIRRISIQLDHLPLYLRTSPVKQDPTTKRKYSAACGEDEDEDLDLFDLSHYKSDEDEDYVPEEVDRTADSLEFQEGDTESDIEADLNDLTYEVAAAEGTSVDAASQDDISIDLDSIALASPSLQHVKEEPCNVLGVISKENIIGLPNDDDNTPRTRKTVMKLNHVPTIIVTPSRGKENTPETPDNTNNNDKTRLSPESAEREAREAAEREAMEAMESPLKSTPQSLPPLDLDGLEYTPTQDGRVVAMNLKCKDDSGIVITPNDGLTPNGGITPNGVLTPSL